VVKKVSDITITIAGTGEMTPRLKELAVSLKVDSHVDFVGLVDHSEVYALLEKHHIMVMPSLQEAFGVAALEASACGRPVIASRVGGVPEVVEDGVTGLLVPPGDVGALAEAIVGLARDRERCERMGRAGREMVRQRYRWEHSLDMMSELYESLIDGQA